MSDTTLIGATAALLGAVLLWAMRSARRAVERGELTLGYRDHTARIAQLEVELAAVRTERDELRGRIDACQSHAERCLEQLVEERHREH